MYFVYILRCQDGSLYTGITTDFHRRLAEHRGQGGRGARYTASHPPLGFEAVWQLPSRGEALRLESRIKALTRREKEQLLQDGALPGGVTALRVEIPPEEGVPAGDKEE